MPLIEPGSFAILQHEIAIPVIGCIAPTLLLAGLIFAGWRFCVKRPKAEVLP
jgi:hypothetical protein